MSIRIGWSLKRPRDHRSGRVAGGIYLFELLKTNEGQGRHVVVGTLTYTREDLERIREKGYKLDVRVIGLLRFTDGVTPELFRATIDRVRVTGMISMPGQLEGPLVQLQA